MKPRNDRINWVFIICRLLKERKWENEDQMVSLLSRSRRPKRPQLEFWQNHITKKRFKYFIKSRYGACTNEILENKPPLTLWERNGSEIEYTAFNKCLRAKYQGWLGHSWVTRSALSQNSFKSLTTFRSCDAGWKRQITLHLFYSWKKVSTTNAWGSKSADTWDGSWLFSLEERTTSRMRPRLRIHWHEVLS